jgi:hypothetical protein
MSKCVLSCSKPLGYGNPQLSGTLDSLDAEDRRR